MEINKILKADVLDIIFDGKNKQYGAYDLRKSYNKRILKALFVTASITLMLFLGSVFANIMGKGKKETIEVIDTEMAKLKKEIIQPVIPPPPPPQVTPPPPLNQVKFNPPRIVPDEDVTPEDQVQDIDDNQVISSQTIASDNTNQVVQAPVEDPGTGVVAVPKVKDDENQVYVTVEVEAAYDGDWNSFLKKYLNGEVPAENGAPEGTYTVVVKFVVSKDGSLSDISCETDPGFGICQEAIRVIKKTKNWKPALQNGHNVNAYRRQPITFMVQGQ